MTRMAGKALVACGVTLALAWGVGAGPAMAQTVRIYNCMHASEDMNKRFEAKLGVKTALLRLSCGEMWARIQAETKEGKDPGGIQADLMEASAASGGEIVPAKRDRVRRHEAPQLPQDLLPCALIAHRPVDQTNQHLLRVSWRFGVWLHRPHDRPPFTFARPRLLVRTSRMIPTPAGRKDHESQPDEGVPSFGSNPQDEPVSEF